MTMAPHNEAVEEQQEPEAIGIPETNTEKPAEEEEEGNFRSFVTGGLPMPLSCGFRRKDKVFYVPDPRKQRAKTGPYEVLGAREGPPGQPPLYTLKGLNMEVSEKYLAY